MRTLVLLFVIIGVALSKQTKRQTACGTSTVRPHFFTPYIVGGRESVPHSWPWQVVMEYRGAFRCGGSLAYGANGDVVVITAAHCTEGTVARSWVIRTGVHSRSANEVGSASYGVASIIDHPQYSGVTLVNDISIMKLSTRVVLNDKTNPICITSRASSNYVGVNCVVTGWGTTSESGSTTDKLQEVYKPIDTDANCRSLVSGFDPTTMVCAGVPEGGKDACQGDSGGPMACLNNGVWDLVGIVSWGYGCARPLLPGVYSDVHNYINWINQNTV